MKILSAEQLKQADTYTVEKANIPSINLMERAATLCFQWIHARLNGNGLPIHVFCGPGNNGGDGLVIARHLKQHGYNVFVYVVNSKKDRTQEFLINYDRLKEIGVWATILSEDTEMPAITENDMVIDAIFGLGISRKPAGVFKKVIQHINASNAYVLAIDVPSGLYADKPVDDTEVVIKAYHVLTFQTPKTAFFLPESKNYLVSHNVIDIGLDSEFIYNLEANKFVTEKMHVLAMYKPRQKFSHKGDYGHSLIIGGSYGKIGAVSLASRAALNIGSGLVTAYIPKCGYQVLQTALPEVMVEVDAENQIENIDAKIDATVIGIGVGLGTATKTFNAFAEFLKKNKTPLVIDADAINLLAKDKKLLGFIPEGSVLTPHPKEFERLVGQSKNDFERLHKLEQLAKQLKSIVLLKGAHTAIAFDDKIFFNNTGNTALATAGSGDVLTGIITGLMAQGYTALEATVFGVYLHGKTAEVAMQDLVLETFTASDIIEYLPIAIKDLFKREAPPQQVKSENAEEEE